MSGWASLTSIDTDVISKEWIKDAGRDEKVTVFVLPHCGISGFLAIYSSFEKICTSQKNHYLDAIKNMCLETEIKVHFTSVHKKHSYFV